MNVRESGDGWCMTKINEDEVLKRYMDWVDQLATDLDWQTVISPETIVAKIIEIIEEIENHG